MQPDISHIYLYMQNYKKFRIDMCIFYLKLPTILEVGMEGVDHIKLYKLVCSIVHASIFSVYMLLLLRAQHQP